MKKGESILAHDRNYVHPQIVAEKVKASLEIYHTLDLAIDN